MKRRKSVCEALSLEYNEKMFKPKHFYSFCKRCSDILLSGISLILLSPLYLIIMILVKCTSKGPIFYSHKRIGKNGKEFKMLKFRTMKVDNRPIEEILTPEQLEEWKKDYKVTNDPRITKFGKFLRKSSLDELPQLWDVFVGKMSIVSWRPIIDEELLKYSTEERKLLLKIKPGVTGFWSSHGRSSVTYEERVKMELYYVYKRSFWLDLRIMYHTVIGVFRRDGAK